MNETDNNPVNNAIIISEIQLLLAEKRTSLATLRTGIAIFVLPLTVVSFLIATSQYYKIVNVLHLFLPLMLACFLLAVFGGYLVIRALRKIRRFEDTIEKLKARHSKLSEIIY
ncbi:MAG: hypothetical protein JXK94_11755 [Deltaproteobacteria bacterium]|nr:hypothetical protein [Deltaproteobacteria bacterium]